MVSPTSLFSSTKTKNNFRYDAMVDAMPIAVMTCRVSDFKIDYANKKSVELLGELRDVLVVAPEEIVGTTVDVFHKRPEHQRKLLGDPKNLPHSAVIQVADEYLDLNISAMHDDKGKYTHAMLTWSIVTDKVKTDAETKRLMQMIDKMPVNIMTADLNDDFKINYINQTSINTLKSVEAHLPVKAEDIAGKSIDIFHKAPEHQRQLLRDPNNLPHSAKIKVGPETLRLDVSAIHDDELGYVGPMLSWSVITQNIQMGDAVSDVVGQITGQVQSMGVSASTMKDVAARVESLSASVSGASEEMAGAIKEISTQVANATQSIDGAVREASETDQLVGNMDSKANSIGGVIQVIDEIADKTNLLALNATIEAARAGEAGKGFAVVASEVKSLAQQTTKSTEEIRSEIESMQEIASGTVVAISRISESITAMNEIFTNIAAAIEEQTVTTATVTQDIAGVSEAAREAGEAADNVKGVAEQLSKHSQSLQTEVTTFLES